MGKIIAIANQKGGVAKTTTCVNLAASLAATQRSVLVVDLDPQGNASMGSGIDKNLVARTANDVLLGHSTLDEAVVHSPGGYSLLASNADLTQAEIDLLKMDTREHRLSQALQSSEESYDFVLIDCPPSLNMLTVNALVASHSVLIPMQCEYYALEGLSSLMDTIEQLTLTANPDLKIEGLLRTLYDARNCLTTQVSDQLLQHFGNLVYDTVIPRNIRLAEAPSFGLPALLYDKNSSGAQAYFSLAEELIRRHENEYRVAPLVVRQENSELTDAE